MSIVESAIGRPVTVAVGVMFVALFGFISLFRIPIQLTPDVDRPAVTVTTTWPGSSPEEMEQEIVQRQEEMLKSVEGLVKMTSQSFDSRSEVSLEFKVGMDPEASLLKVSNRLDQVTGYPLDADRPIVTSGSSANTGWITWLILDVIPGQEGEVDVERFRDLAEDVVKAALERVPGVAQSNVFGGYEREMEVVVDADALAAHEISVSDLATAISIENVNISAGSFDEGKRRYIVRTVGQFTSPEDIEAVVIRSDQNGRTLVGDVANARLGYKRTQATVRIKGRPAIAINATREPGSNVLVVMESIRETMAALNQGILAQHRLALRMVYDETDYIGSAIDLVRSNIVVGGALAIAVLLVFLRSFTSVIMIATSIPISLVGTFLVMSLLGRNINVISLAGMAFAVGMLVDNAIVALENVFRHMEMGKSRRDAAYDGIVEVWGALLASTLTTVAIFLPIVFVEDEAGQLFRDIAIAVSCSVTLSLITAITVIPSMANRLMRTRLLTNSKDEVLTQTDSTLRHQGSIERFGHRVRHIIAQTIYRISGSTLLRFGVVVLLVGSSAIIVRTFAPKAEYLPTGNRNLIFAILLPPPGYNLDELIQVGHVIEDILRPRWEAQVGTPEAEALGNALVENMFYVAWGQNAFMGASAKDPSGARELIPLIQGPLFGVPGLIPIVIQTSLFERGGRSIDVEITGPDLHRLVALGGQVFGQVSQVLPGAQARPIPSLDLGNPEVRIIPDRIRASELGLTAREIGIAVNALIDGALIDGYQYQGEEIDLTIRGNDDWLRTQDIAQLMIHTPRNRLVPVGSVADVVVTIGPEQINHIERSRAITVQVTPPEGIALETALDDIQKKIVDPLITSGQVAPPYGIALSGTADDLRRTREALQWNFLLALAITYLLMAALFESFLLPLVILLSVPPAAAGGLLGLAAVNLLIAHQPLDILTMLGFVILIGVVVNAAILIVHQTLNTLRSSPDITTREAIRTAVDSRIRPIFMSVITSTCGMLPLVLFPGAGSELYRGLGSVVIGGLLVSTLFTLFLVPTFLSLALDFKVWVARTRN